MGLLDNLAKRVADQIVKAPSLPVGAVTMTETEMRNAQSNTTNYGNSTPLPREPFLASVPFAPGNPITPGSINPLNPNTNRPDPRRYEFQVAQNVNVTETRLISFKTLRAAADQIDILRRCIEVLKAKMLGLDWDIVLSEDSGEKIISDIGGNQVRAAEQARAIFNEEINRMKDFWKQPDKQNGLLFSDWLSIALEEILVLDALAVWPQESVGGDLLGLQILDGSTIKPLIDDRGMRPVAPYPAFQQILMGFPRSEFSVSDEDDKADGEFSSDELAYMIRNRRTMTVYGYSPTERALPLADIYLRRQQWLRAEYTDGVTPELLMKTDANFGNNPDLLRAYENIFNDELAGQTEQRKRVRLLPLGMEPVQFEGYGERFKDTLDEYLVNSICGHFGVLPSEIGFTPKGGLGGAGHQQGQAQSSEVIGAIPLAQWLARMISHLSYVFCGMPRELEFKFMPSGRNDLKSMAEVREIEMRNAGATINEIRSESGKTLFDIPEADMPMVIVGGTGFFLTEDGVKPFADVTEDVQAATVDRTGIVVDTDAQDETVTNASTVEDTSAVKAQQEIKLFLKWIKKSPDRAFNFVEVPATYSQVLNKFISVKDYDSARWYAERYLA